MSNTLQYLDYEGLKYYDKKLKESLKDYMPENGVDGKDGLTPTIGDNGNWWIGTTDTGVKAAGKDGVDGATGANGTSVTITSTNKVDGVTTITFSDGSTITINDGVDGEDGKDGDELNLLLGEEIKTNVTCGALTAGSSLDSDLTLADIVKLLTTTVKAPTLGSAPSASLTMSDQDTTVEVGTKITPTLTPKFTDGKINTYGKGAINSTSKNAGCVVTGCVFKRNDTNISETTGSTLSAYADSYTISEETVTYKAEISYNKSTFVPQNSNGESVESIYHAAGTKTSNTAQVVGKYQYYTGIGDVNPTASQIRIALNGTSNWVVDGGVVSITNTTTTKTIFAIPNNYELTEAMSVNTNDDLMSDFKEEQITIKDAGGSDTIYKMYVMTNAQPGNLLVKLTYKKI